MEVEKRLEYLKEKTAIRKIGVLHDPTPYANVQKNAAEKNAANYGLEIVGIEQYKQDDADMSVQISKLNAAGAKAILKIGIGGTHADGGQEHQAARPRPADADQRRGSWRCSGRSPKCWATSSSSLRHPRRSMTACPMAR